MVLFRCVPLARLTHRLPSLAPFRVLNVLPHSARLASLRVFLCPPCPPRPPAPPAPQIIGSLVVFVGSVIPVLPPFFQGFFGSGPAAAAEAASGLDSPFWIFVFFLSDIPSAAVNVLEEKVFGAPFFADEIHYLAFTNLITLVG